MVSEPPKVNVSDPSAAGERVVSWVMPPGTPATDVVDVVLRPSLWHARATLPAVTVSLPQLAPGDYTVEVRSCEPDGLGAVGVNTFTVKQLRASSRLLGRISWGVFAAQAGATLGCGIAAAVGGRHQRVLVDLTFAFGVLTVVFALLQALGRDSGHSGGSPNRTGLCRVVVGNDGRVSASELQTALWTWLVAFIVAYFAARSWFDGIPHLFDGVDAGDTGSANAVWPAYLGLLGGPFIALVAARGIDASKTKDGSVQKAPADASEPASLKQVLTNDNGSLSVINTQYLVFNLVALAYVIAGLASTNRLPAIPGLLVSLTGSSAGAYVLNKAVAVNGPALTSVVPSSVTPGEDILLLGSNLVPAGSHTPPMVTVGGMQALVQSDANAGRVTVTVPVTLAAGPADVVVTTFAEAATDPRLVIVLPDVPVIFQATTGTPAGGALLTITGSNLGVRDRSGRPRALVILAGVTSLVEVEVAGISHRIVVPAPSPAPGATVAVRTLRGAVSAGVAVTAAAVVP